MNEYDSNYLIDKFCGLIESSQYFANVPRMNLGIWSAYKKLDDTGKEKFRKFMRLPEIKFSDIRDLSYWPAKNAKDKIDAIKYQAFTEKEREAAYELEQVEKQKILDEIDAEYERRGLDPEFRHLGFDQDIPEN